MREAGLEEDNYGLKFNGRNINDLQHADDTILHSGNRKISQDT